MHNEVELISPKGKHIEADAVRKKNVKKESTPLWDTVVDAINKSGGYSHTSSVVIHGIITREFCLIPCEPASDTDSEISKVLQKLRGIGYYADIFRAAYEISETISKTRCMILVSWDPKVIMRSCIPKFYTIREGSMIPCANCSVNDREYIKTCEGCDTFLMWLPGVTPITKLGDPCLICYRSNRDKYTDCTSCPAKKLYNQLKHDK